MVSFSTVAVLVGAYLASSVHGQATTAIRDASVCGTPVPGRPNEQVTFVADGTTACW